MTKVVRQRWILSFFSLGIVVSLAEFEKVDQSSVDRIAAVNHGANEVHRRPWANVV